ncbi:MAG: triose-phosphate isomerase [Melioribacteraceae bacterium]|nr:triose-phosphate isomerase [Melioribacteraceae bacterium]
MRKICVAGNWKMNKDLNEAVSLISELKKTLENQTINADVIICPPAIALETSKTLIEGTAIQLGAQNMHFADSGAYTGELSASMLKSVGCKYVILGHSERRTIFGESNEVINKKVKKALADGVDPIFCIGETLEERESGVMQKVIEEQVRKGLAEVTVEELGKVIVAYEPVWAIGTGKTASPEQAQEVHAFIRGLLKEMYSEEAAEKVIIQYGGSVKPGNADKLLSQKDIDGALVGGACLDAESFFGIIKAAK